VGITVRQLAPGVADTDHGLALEYTGAETFGAHPGSVDEPKFIGPTKPISTAQLDAVVHVESSLE
jgi:hypothetical protein